MSCQQQRQDNDDAVRSAFRAHGPFPRRWPISDEDLEAYLDAEYDTSDGSGSLDSTERYETDTLGAAGDQTILVRPCSYGSFQQELLGRRYLILEPRQRSQASPLSNLVRPKCVGIFALGLVLLGTIYLGSSVLKAMLFLEEQGATSPVQSLT